MEFKGPNAYEQSEFLKNFLERRNREDSPNNIIEKPIIMTLIGNVKGKSILDLGCGDARFGAELIEAGCGSYVGVEGSVNMVKEAQQNLNTPKVQIHHASLENWNYPKAEYDLILSRLVFHYLKDIQHTFQNIYQALKKDGRFIFSVQHPVLTSSTQSAQTSEKRSAWLVDDYFESGKRVEPWINKDVVKYHRTIEEYFQSLKAAGFKIDDISECTPHANYFKNEEEYKRRKRIPLYLVFGCTK